MLRFKSLYIKKYKNIEDQTFDFSSNTGYIALIGLNGSGKSNLMEAISLVFQGLFDKKTIPFEYEIKYEMDGHIYERKKQFAKRDGIRVKNEEMQYPSSVIACYSGESSRLWNAAYEDYYMHYFKGAIRNKSFSPQLIYINKYCWKIAFLSLLCSSKAIVKSFLKQTLHIDDITKISVQFIPDSGKREMFSDHKACKWFDTIYQLQNEDPQRIINANVLASIDMMTYGAPRAQAPDYVFQFLFLLALPEKNADKGQTVDKLITDINITINGVNFDDLSEGEKKMILVECITQVLGVENTLVLLDEPDAHIHIALKKELLNCVEKFGGQTLFTTHSPMFANQMAETNIFPMVEGKFLPQEKRILIQKIANNEISVIDSACIVSSKYVLLTEGPDDIFHIKSAISAFSSKDEKYKELEKLSYIFMGGAKEVDNYYNEILEALYKTMSKIVFAFDYDEEGREGAKMVQKLIDRGLDKFAYVFYHKTYPVPDPNLDFYLEDFFERTAYKDILLPNFNGEPTFAELKKASTWANSIKKRIQRHKRENSLTPNDYAGFQEFLNQLNSSFGF